MKLTEYQKETDKTAIYPKERAIEYVILGLVGEAGEIANKYKKVIRDDEGVLTTKKRQELAGELGDVLWYLTRLTSELGFDLNQIANLNLTKLMDRKNRNVIGGSGDKR